MPRRPLDIPYQTQHRCPACDGAGREVGALGLGRYLFGPFEVPYPDGSGGRIPLMACATCGLVYKRHIPTREGLRDLYARCAADIWHTPSAAGVYEPVRALIAGQGFGAGPTDILDIGSSDGGLLARFADVPGRRSALDAAHFPECARHVRDEYIEGFIEERLTWSREPYDVVTAFDLLEHLYDPNRAFENIRALMRDRGILVVETGNLDARGTRLGDWWYLNLLDHHICWSPMSLSRAAARHGMEVQSVEVVRHKGRAAMRPAKWALSLGCYALRNVAPLRRAVYRASGSDLMLFVNPLARDHMRVVIRKAPAAARAEALAKSPPARLAGTARG